MKRLICLIMTAVLLCISLLPITASAVTVYDYTLVSKGASYEYTDCYTTPGLGYTLVDGKELTKTEYIRLINTANNQGNYRLKLILETICATGIRVSELQYITVEAVKKGEALISLKGKTRYIFIVKQLRK